MTPRSLTIDRILTPILQVIQIAALIVWNSKKNKKSRSGPVVVVSLTKKPQHNNLRNFRMRKRTQGMRRINKILNCEIYKTRRKNRLPCGTILTTSSLRSLNRNVLKANNLNGTFHLTRKMATRKTTTTTTKPKLVLQMTR